MKVSIHDDVLLLSLARLALSCNDFHSIALSSVLCRLNKTKLKYITFSIAEPCFMAKGSFRIELCYVTI